MYVSGAASVIFLMVITIGSQPLCESGSKKKSCCFPSVQPDCTLQCLCQYLLLVNSSNVLCSKHGELQTIQVIDPTFPREPFCTRTCPLGFQVSVLKSTLTCSKCRTTCNIQNLMKMDYTSETNTNYKAKRSEMPTISIVLSTAAITGCGITLAIIIYFLKKMRRLANSSYNGHRQGKKRNKRDGAENEAYESAENEAYKGSEKNIVTGNQYKPKKSEQENDEDGYKAYEENSGFVSAPDDDDIDLHANQTFKTDYHLHDETANRTTYNRKQTSHRTSTDHIVEKDNSTHLLSPEKFTSGESVKLKDSNYANLTNRNNVKLSVNTTEKVLAILSSSLNSKTVNELIAVNTNTINIDHAENVSIHNTTTVQFTHIKHEKQKVESDKRSNTW
ncbi:unnamed protein product [Mytilus edulis]|uniref:Uncharacterized protein n=1 Tax=Mytilus edulis TaxID=6550 RepID=A0A8S3QW76_MYTED|nr:unnamed protein product [Mytilus edulis]